MNDSIMKMMEQDFAETLSSSVERVDHNGVKSIATLAASIRDKERDVRVMEDTLKEAKKQLLKLTDEDLPSLMQEIGISSLTLDDGSVVEVKHTYGASILVDNRPAAYEWLRENRNPYADITGFRKRTCGIWRRVSDGTLWCLRRPTRRY